MIKDDIDYVDIPEHLEPFSTKEVNRAVNGQRRVSTSHWRAASDEMNSMVYLMLTSLQEEITKAGGRHFTAEELLSMSLMDLYSMCVPNGIHIRYKHQR